MGYLPGPDQLLTEETHTLLTGEKVLVLASSVEGQPWCASVYFAHRGSRFYFFSSPDSRHIREFRLHPEAAGCVSADHTEWHQIRGVQMQGRVEAVRGAREKFTALKAYLKKFPFVKAFLREQSAAGELSLGKLLGGYLFVFVAEKVYRLDNQHGFGSRVRVEL